jgi:hypothetical protein
MNIFPIADNGCPIASAQQLCNRHIVKMPLETGGMLAFAFPEGETSIFNNRSNRHYLHPASRWVRESIGNMEWTIIHGLVQCEEYSKRYKRRHAIQDFIEWAEKNYKFLAFEKQAVTPFARCFGVFKEMLDGEKLDTLQAYRKFYWLDKQSFAKWSSLKAIPQWWQEISEKYVDKAFVNGEYSRR